MENNGIGCMVCHIKFGQCYALKKHMSSKEHVLKIQDVFRPAKYQCTVFLPFITVLNPPLKQPIIGLSMLTLCINRDPNTFFYLCHVCEEMLAPGEILCHLRSGDHCANYFSFTNPNALKFSWFPSTDMNLVLTPAFTMEVYERGPGVLQLLDLPQELFKKLETSSYSEVMRTLGEKEKLLKLFEGVCKENQGLKCILHPVKSSMQTIYCYNSMTNGKCSSLDENQMLPLKAQEQAAVGPCAVKPERTMIQTYHKDSNRKHPLLGMQHVVECTGPNDKSYYLCTLCKLTLATHTIIRHVLSFDHIFHYFRAWHPSTLLSRQCYKDYTSSSIMLDLAKQAEEIHGTANTEMKKVSLEPAEFELVNFTCYAEAFKKLESISKEKMKSSLITSVQPGRKLVMQSVPTGPVALSFKIRCQDCNQMFVDISLYFNHVLHDAKHKRMMNQFFGKAEKAHSHDQPGIRRTLGLYTHILESSKKNQPPVGVPLVVTCFSTHVQEHIYVCFACEDCFTESSLKQHFDSRKHLIHTLLYLNPWRLPFAWKYHLGIEVLRSLALEEEEEKERGPKKMMMKVLDIPYEMFLPIPSTFVEVLKRLELQHTLLKREVPERKTYSELKQSERFPLLGQEFLVMFDLCVKRLSSTEVGFLCSLCERRLSYDECYTHVFSWEHVAEFLDRFHPGSLNSSTDAETLLDLAKQAARIHIILPMQKIKLVKPVWDPCPYQRAIRILQSAKWRDGNGNLVPQIVPKMKLVPRETLKDADNDHVRGRSQKTTGMMEEKITSIKSDLSETSLTETKVKAEITDSVESGETAEKVLDTKTPAPKEKEAETTFSEELTNAGCETYQAIKEEKMEEPTARNPSGEAIQGCHNTNESDGTEIGEERGKSSKDVPTQLKNCTNREKESERLRSFPEKSQEIATEIGHKRHRLSSKQDATMCEEPQYLPSNRQKEAAATDEGESGKPFHKTAKDEESFDENHDQADQLWQYVKRDSREPVVGLDAIFECYCDQHNPIYLCECCSVKLPERDIVSHVTGAQHQKMYLMELLKLPHPPEMKIRQWAASFEQDNRRGEAQVVDVDEEMYNNILKQNFESAIQTVKALQNAEKDSCRELPSTSDVSGVQRVDTSVPPQDQVYSVTDNFQVTEIGIADLEDCETQPPSLCASVSAMTEPSSRTSKVLPESNEDIKMNQITVSPESTYKSCNSTAPISKLRATSSNCTTSTTKSKETADKWHATTKVTETSYKVAIASNSQSTVVGGATCSTACLSKMENRSVPQSFVATSSAKAVQTDMSASSTAKVKNHIHEGDTPGAPHLIQLMSVRSDTNNPSTEPSCTSANKKKPSEVWPKVGVDQLIVVSCKERQQVYCRLCSIKLADSSHLTSFKHQFNYMKMRHPNWILYPSELKRKRELLLPHLSALEKEVGPLSSQRIEVTIDEYNRLSSMGTKRALEKLPVMLREKGSPASFYTSETAEAWRQQVLVTSPCDVLSPDDVNAKRGTFEFQAMDEDTPANENPAVKGKKPQGCANPVGSDSESSGRLPNTPDVSQETAEKRQQEGIDPGLQESHNILECIQKTSPEKLFDPDPLTSAAPDNKEQQIASRSCKSVEHVPLTSPSHQSALPELQRISIAVTAERTQSCSDVLTYLKVRGLDPETILGLGSVWMCREASQESFFLCESCSEKLLLNDICQHIVSFEHLFNCMQRDYNHLLSKFWWEEDVEEKHKWVLLEEVAHHLSGQERFNNVDVQCVQLSKELHDCVGSAPFREAIHILQNIKTEKKLTIKSQPSSAPQQKDQQLEDLQSLKESLPKERLSPQAQLTELRSDNAGQTTEKQQLEETVMFGDLDRVQERKIVSPPDVTSFSSKADPVLSPLPGTGTCLSPQETCESLPMQAELKPRVPQHQIPIPDLQVKPTEVYSESPSSSISPKIIRTLSMSPRDKCLQTRKRPAVDDLVRPGTKNPELEDQLSAKCARSSLPPTSQTNLESASELTLVDPLSTSNLLSPKDIHTGPGYDEQNQSMVDDLIALVHEKRSELKMYSCIAKPNNVETSTSCTENSSQSGVERRWDPKGVQTCSEMPNRIKRWDVLPATVKTNPPYTYSSEDKFSTAAPLVVGHENQLVTPNANNSYVGSSFMQGNLLSTASEAKAVTMLPCASTADPGDLQHYRSINAQSVFGNVRQSNHSPFYCEATNRNTSQTQQHWDNTKAERTGVTHMPISSIITPRQYPSNKQLMGDYNGKDRSEGNRDNQVDECYSTVTTASPNDTELAVSRGQVQHSQMAYFRKGHSGFFPSEAFSSDTTPGNPPVYSGSLHQHAGYPEMGLYQSMIYTNQESFSLQSFVPSSATPMQPGWVGLERQQEQLINQQQLMQRQQVMQQPYYLAPAPGNANRTNEAGIFFSGPFTTTANDSQHHFLQ